MRCSPGLLALVLVVVTSGLSVSCGVFTTQAVSTPCNDDGDCASADERCLKGACKRAPLPQQGGVTVDGSDEDGTRDSGQLPVGCEASGGVFGPGDVHPTFSCLVCSPEDEWQATCDAGETCTVDGCKSGCVIGGVPYAFGESASGAPCWRCDADVSTVRFTPVPLGEACSDDDACTIESACDGLGTCAPVESFDCSGLDDECSYGQCSSSNGACARVLQPLGTPCGEGAFCDGAGDCTPSCFLEERLYFDGEPLEEGACLGCAVQVATTEVTQLPVGTPCADGLSCDGFGSCGPACHIGGAFVTNGADDPSNACRYCDGTKSQTAWQVRDDFVPCGDDTNICGQRVCVAGTCSSRPLPADTPCGAGVCDGAGTCSAPQPVTVIVHGEGTVQSVPAGLDCSDQCEALFPFSIAVSLTATPAAGHLFTGFSGACSGTSSCALTTTGPREVIATFAPQQAEIILSKPGNGVGLVTSQPAGLHCGTSCTASFPVGTSLTLSATAQTGTSAFGGFLGGGCGSDFSCTLVVEGDLEIEADFALLPRRLVIETAGDGTGVVVTDPAGIECGASCSADFPHGTLVSVSVVPADGSVFAGYEGACVGTGACVVEMTAPRNLVASFVVAPSKNLQVTLVGEGTGTVLSTPAGIACGQNGASSSCSAGFTEGGQVVLSAEPAASSVFSGWVGAGCTGSTAACTVTMTTDQAVSASFSLRSFDVDVEKVGAGSGTVTSDDGVIDCGQTCSAAYPFGSVVTLSAVADANNSSTFVGWEGACTGTGICEVTLDEATLVKANFGLLPRTITVTKDGAGSGTVQGATSTTGLLFGPDFTCGAACSDTFAAGTLVYLNATPSSDSTFVQWGGACSGSSVTCAVTLDDDKAVNATFALAPRTLTITREGDRLGTVTSSPAGISCGSDCSEVYLHGSVVTLTAAPVNDDQVVWSDNCTLTTSGNCQVTMTAARTVTATFTRRTRTLDVEVS
ncbi:MAG: InlB B-repeat-containing protein, partial [Myxococcota bacterium]